VLLAGLFVGVLVTGRWRWLLNPWTWAGAAAALFIWLPNIVWQIQHDFVGLAFTSAIHARDVAIGRTRSFVPEQFFVSTNPITVPLWILGLWFYLFAADGRKYRLIGWLYVATLALFLLLEGRSYYLGAAYPMLFAAGGVVLERCLAARSDSGRRLGKIVVGAGVDRWRSAQPADCASQLRPHACAGLGERARARPIRSCWRHRTGQISAVLCRVH
jgi:hypothetical protein